MKISYMFDRETFRVVHWGTVVAGSELESVTFAEEFEMDRCR